MIRINRGAEFMSHPPGFAIHDADGAAGEIADVQLVIFRIVAHRVSADAGTHVAQRFAVFQIENIQAVMRAAAIVVIEGDDENTP